MYMCVIQQQRTSAQKSDVRCEYNEYNDKAQHTVVAAVHTGSSVISVITCKHLVAVFC
jgi:HKD family nuclease